MDMAVITRMRNVGLTTYALLVFACAPRVADLGDNDSTAGKPGNSGEGNGGGTSGGTQGATGGSSTSVITTPSTEVLSHGESNETTGGGYFWTFLDRSGRSLISPFTGKVAPNEPASTQLNPPISKGNGIEDEGSGNLAFHVAGKVSPQPIWSAALGFTGGEWADTYWNAFFGFTCLNGGCQEVKYPEAGLGMSLLSNNRPTNLGEKYLGITFRAKVGSKHAVDETTGTYFPVTFQAVSDLTDAPDPSLGDEFGDRSKVQLRPYCTFPGSTLADGITVVGSTYKTCFAHFETLVALDDSWKTTCTKWSEFEPPYYADEAFKAAAIYDLDTSRVIKFRWAAFQPSELRSEALFDFWVDDVALLTCKNWSQYCGNLAAPASCGGAT